MGMTDLQFKAYLKEIVSDLKKVIEEAPESKTAKEMLQRYEEVLKS